VETITEQKNNFKRDFAGFAVAMQFGILFITYIASPGYIIPFLNNPIAKSVVFFLLLWQVLGLALYAYSPVGPERKILFALQTVVLLLVFLAPFTLTYMLGLAVPTQPMMAM